MFPMLIFHRFYDLRTLWQVKAKEELDTKDWRDLPNMFEDGAKSRYYMEANTRYEGAVNGAVSVAFWGTEAAKSPSQFYYLDGDTTTVKGLKCTGNKTPDAIDVYLGNDTTWGSVFECEQGPSLTDDLLLLYDDKTAPPPTIIMTSSEGEVFIIVEENISYPSFLYSVWTVESENGTSTELKHAFHIAATMRLVEAVVTGIVHGERSGGGCFGVLRKFSETRVPCENIVLRASPFGEHPKGDSVRIQDLEHLEVGLEISMNALVCFVCIMVLTSIGIAWLCSVRSSIGMDVYDRDEIIRAVSMPETTTGCTVPSQMRIFVRKDDSGEIKVVINDARDARSLFARFLKHGMKKDKDSDPKLTATAVAPCGDGFSGTVVPLGSREVMLEGVRVRPMRSTSLPGRIFHCPASVSLTVSPVPWKTSSVPGSPGQYIHPAQSVARMGRRNTGGMRASSLFDTVYISGDSDDGETDVSQASHDKAANCGGSSGAYTSAFTSRRRAMTMPEGVNAFDIEMPKPKVTHGMYDNDVNSDGKSGARASALAGRRRVAPMLDGDDHSDLEATSQQEHGRDHGTSQYVSDGTTTAVSAGSLPLPPSFLRRAFTLVPPLSAPLTQNDEGETTGRSSVYEDVC